MPTLYSKASLEYGAAGAFNTLANGTGVDTVPVDGDKILIQNTHTITVGGTYVVGVDGATDSVTVQSGGIFKASRTATSSFTVRGEIVVASGGTWDYGTVASPIPAAYTATLVLNRAAVTNGITCFTGSTGFTSITFNGDEARKRWTTITGTGPQSITTSVSLADTTGWAIGDDIIITMSSGNNAAETERRTLTGLVSWTGALAVATRQAGSAVGNLYSNVIVKSFDTTKRALMRMTIAPASVDTVEIRYTKFEDLGVATNQQGVSILPTAATTLAQYQARAVKSFHGNVFISTTSSSSWTATGTIAAGAALSRPVTVSNNVFYSYTAGQGNVAAGGAEWTFDSNLIVVAVMHAQAGVRITYSNNHIALNDGTLQFVSSFVKYISNFWYGRWQAFAVVNLGGNAILEGNDFGSTIPLRHQFGDAFMRDGPSYGGYWSVTSLNDKFNAASSPILSDTSLSGQQGDTTLAITNKGGVLTAQEIHKGTGKSFRENTIATLSTSSVSLKPIQLAVNHDFTTTIPVASGSSITVRVYVLPDPAFYNGGAWTAPVVSLSEAVSASSTVTYVASSATGTALTVTGTNTYTRGAGSFITDGFAVGDRFYAEGFTTSANNGSKLITAITATAMTVYGGGLTNETGTASARITKWFMAQVSGTNSGADANATLTFRTNPSTVLTGTVYFTGCPTSSPFVTKARQYGYTYDESSPLRTLNGTVPATEVTALGYTGIGVTGATSAIALSASTTFQKIYDHTQAWAVQNLTFATPLTGAGTAGSPILTAVGAIATTGFTLNGGGSLNMGSLTLSGSIPWTYTYTGGVFSQAASTPSYSGGTLNINAAGSFTFVQAAAMILRMTPTAPSTYVLGGSTFTGQVDLRNATAHAITVELLSGTTYTTANNTGGTITVTLPTVYANISVTSMPDIGAVPTRLQIFNSTGAAAAAWAASSVYATGVIRRRTTGIGSENTAGLYMRATTGGTSAATEPTWNTTVGGTTADGSVVWTTYAVLYYDADPASTSYATTYIDGKQFLSGETVKVRFAEMNGATSFKRYSTTLIAAASGFSAAVDVIADDVFATNALDGAAYETTFSPNFTLNYIVLDTNTDFSGKAAYAYFCYTLTTTNGMYKFWGGVTALDSGNYRIETDVLNLYFDETLGFVKQTDDVRIFRKDGLRPALDPTTGLNGIEINWRTPVNVVSVGGSALTAGQDAKLSAIPTNPLLTNDTRLPATLIASSANIPTSTQNAAAVGLRAITATLTADQSQRVTNAILFGKVSGAGTGVETFRNPEDTKTVCTVTVDANGNRTLVVLDAT